MSGSPHSDTTQRRAREIRRGVVSGDEPLHTYTRTVCDNSGSYYLNIPKRVAEAWGLDQGDEVEFAEFVDKAEVRPADE